MRVILFQPRFHEAIRKGVKRSTIRNRARCKKGDVLSLRRWTDKPYRSKQEELMEVTCRSVDPIHLWISAGKLNIIVGSKHNGHWLVDASLQAMARQEGFTDVADMQKWFENNHGKALAKTLSAELISWRQE